MQDADRFQGYVADAGYTDRFFRELSPSWLRYVAALHGLTPRPLDEPFTYLELGCGFGTSVVINAGAYPHAAFHACDLNPSHIAGARRQADAFGIGNLTLHEASFADLLARDLPASDFIVLHGVYSWVSSDAREAVRRVIARVARAHTLVYVSYNCLPGWAAEIPIRRLLVEIAATAAGDSASRTSAAVRAVQTLATAHARYFSTHRAAASAVDSYTRSPANYLAHEFLNESWEPFYSVDVGDQMAACGLRLVGSATLADNHPLLTVDAATLEAVRSLPTARQRQLAMDFAVNQRFRRDVFVKEPAESDSADVTLQLPVVAAGFGDLPLRVRVPRGDVRFQPAFLRDLTDMVSRGPVTIGDIAERLGRDAAARDEIVRNVHVLVAGHALTPCASEHASAPAVERALSYVAAHGVSRAIPCPVTGNGVVVHPVEALGLLAVLRDTPADQLAEAIEHGMRAHDLAVSHEGETLPDAASFARAASAAATHVTTRVVPAFRRLGLLR